MKTKLSARDRRRVLMKKRARQPEPPPLTYPFSAEVKYRAKMISRYALISKLVKDTILKAFENQARADAATESPAWVKNAISDLRANMIEYVPVDRVGDYADETFEAVRKHTAQGFRRTVTKLGGVFVEPEWTTAMRLFRGRNIDLITAVDKSLVSEVEAVVRAGYESGLRVEKMAKQLQDRVGVSKSHAMLLARDQTNKINGQITQTRQERLGVKRYKWITSRDERVRETHQELDGQIFSWDDPPIISDDGRVGHPGDDYQCRCIAQPVFDF